MWPTLLYQIWSTLLYQMWPTLLYHIWPTLLYHVANTSVSDVANTAVSNVANTAVRDVTNTAVPTAFFKYNFTRKFDPSQSAVLTSQHSMSGTTKSSSKLPVVTATRSSALQTNRTSAWH